MLGREAVWTARRRVARLPPYLAVTLQRYEHKRRTALQVCDGLVVLGTQLCAGWAMF